MWTAVRRAQPRGKELSFLAATPNTYPSFYLLGKGECTKSH